MNHTDENQQLIDQIKQTLDAETLDQDARNALQRARIAALQSKKGAWWKMPWLEFAVSASLVAVLALTLPKTKSVPHENTTGKTLASAELIKVPAPKAPTEHQAAKKPDSSVPDPELLENLDFYEDQEFYQWLSDSGQQGVKDA